MVSGFILKESTKFKPHHWVQVLTDDKWLDFDPFYGYQEQVPENYIPFAYNDNAVVKLENGERLAIEYFLVEDHDYNQRHAAKSATNGSWYDIFDLTRLDIETRTILASLLLLPLGVLVTTIFRHFIGVHSYGVFTPTLIALAITYNQWQTTIITLAVVMFFAGFGRKLYPRKLSRTPRLSIIFTLVAFSMAVGVSIIDYYMPNPEGYAVLLPIVILTSLIDRLFQTMDGKGNRVAYIRLFWTGIITLACLPIVLFMPLGHLLVKFPELHLVTLAAILLVTHYQGRQLMRFCPAFLKEPAALKKEKDDESI